MSSRSYGKRTLRCETCPIGRPNHPIGRWAPIGHLLRDLCLPFLQKLCSIIRSNTWYFAGQERRTCVRMGGDLPWIKRALGISTTCSVYSPYSEAVLHPKSGDTPPHFTGVGTMPFLLCLPIEAGGWLPGSPKGACLILFALGLVMPLTCQNSVLAKDPSCQLVSRENRGCPWRAKMWSFVCCI
jgi:hypothetical protein